MKLASIVSLFAALCCAAALADCSQLPASAPGARYAAAGESAFTSTSSGLLFVSNGRSDSIDIYAARRPYAPMGQITVGLRGPNGMAVDAAGDLFVANVDNATVAEYPPGAVKPSVTYRNGFKRRLTNPLNVAVGDDGTLYLVNYHSIGQGSEVLEYLRNSLTPSLRISFRGGAEGLALDARNNLYVSYNGPTGGRILKFAPGATSGKDLGIALGFAGGLAFDRRGNLLACDQTAPAVDIFPPGATAPSKRLTGGFRDPYQVAFGRQFDRLYVADSIGKNVLVYAYPAGVLVDTIQRSFTAYGVAVSPAAPL